MGLAGHQREEMHMSRSSNGDSIMSLGEYRTGRAYTAAQIAHYAGTSSQNVRNWVNGFEGDGHRMKPVFTSSSSPRGKSRPQMFSFLQLVEVVVAARFRQGIQENPVRLERIRDANEYAREELGIEFPFANLQLWEEGGHILYEFEQKYPGEHLVAISANGQAVLPGIVSRSRDEFDYESDYASKWFPLGRNVPIVLDPRKASGRPTIYQTRVTVETVKQRLATGETVQELSEDYGLDESMIVQAKNYPLAA
jgi:uncharacterized protein (DUF433 family)